MSRTSYYKILIILIAAFAWATPAAAGPFKDFSGAEKQISDFTGDGKWRIVMIWASDCHTCNDEAHKYIKFHEDHKNTDARVLGISIDGKEKHADAKKFLKRHGVTFPSLIGEPVDVVVEYMKLTGTEWIGTPTFLIYSPKGKLMAKQPGAVPVSLIEEFIKSNLAKK